MDRVTTLSSVSEKSHTGRRFPTSMADINDVPVPPADGVRAATRPSTALYIAMVPMATTASRPV